MMLIKRYILVSIIFLLLTSCVFNRKEKQSSGVYIADFSNIGGRRYDTLFTEKEVAYYKNFYLYINYDKTFRFSKPFYKENDTIYGTWSIFPDQLSNLIELHGTKFKYYCQMENWLNGSVPYSNIHIKNTVSSKRLIVKKIVHEFPDVCE